MKAFLTRTDQACTSPLTTHCQSRAPPAADELNVKKKKEGLKTFQWKTGKGHTILLLSNVQS